MDKKQLKINSCTFLLWAWASITLWASSPILYSYSDSTSQVPLADPYILVDNGMYYAYGTHADDGIEVYTSNDLQTWTYQGIALHRDNTTEQRWFWAPEVYHKHGLYYMFYSANEHLFVATSKSPLGPFVQQGGYMMQSILSDEKCIDSSVFFDDENDKAYLFFVRFNDGNCIWSCELNNDFKTPIQGTLRQCINVSDEWEMHQAKVTEGPFIIKHQGLYYLTYSANDYQSQDYAVGYATAPSLNELWIKNRNNPILHRPASLVGTGHHSFFTDINGQLRIVFHAHNSATQVHPRLMYIGSVSWKENTLNIENIKNPKLKLENK